MAPMRFSKDAKLKMKKFKKNTLKKYPRKQVPARLSASRVTYQINKAVSRAVNGVSENKIRALTSFEETGPTAIQPLSLAYSKAFTVGSVPTVWSGITGLSGLGGMSFTQGVTANQRVGKYIYLQKTHFSMEIDMGAFDQFSVPTEFRVVCFKARRSNNPNGVSNVYSQNLFLSPDGTEFGHATSGKTGSDLMMQPLNKKDWNIRSDKRFVLSNPRNDVSATSYSGKYPVMKRLIYNLPYYSKTELINDVPSDLDTNYVIAIYARSLSKDLTANKWEVTTRGSTTFKDM